MKRLVSIVILAVFLFNVGGYYLLFWSLRKHADQRLEAKLDAGTYSHDNAIELKLPVTLPYPLQQLGFSRVDGRFEHQGQFYRLVKQKLENDTLYVVCIRDEAQRKLSRTFSEFVKLTQDPSSDSGTAFNFLSKLLKDFQSCEGVSIAHRAGWCQEITTNVPVPALRSALTRDIAPPPKG